MMKKISVALSLLFCSTLLNAQCNVETSVCQQGQSQPFDFLPTTGPYAGGSFANAGCATGMAGNHDYGFITLNITSGGPLNLLVDGSSNSGFVDVAIFNIPPGVSPCDAILNPSNAIGCNYASNSGGCVQFGTAFPCGSSVPAPNVTAGQEIMIIVQNFSTPGSNSFTLELGPLPGAQSGTPDATISPVSGPICTSDSPFQLVASNMGGNWSGPGVSSDGMFNPAAAGSGTHTINYTIGVAPCTDSDQTTITVLPEATVTVDVDGQGSETTICQGETAVISASVITSSGGATYVWDNGLGAGSSHTVSPTSTTVYTVTATNSDGCSVTETVTVNISPTPVISLSQDEIICIDGTTTISASATGGSVFEFHWGHTSDLGGSQSISPTTPGEYTVYAENEFNCVSERDTVFIDLYPPLSATISPNDTVCPTQIGTLRVLNVSGGNGGPYSYEWKDSDGMVVGTSQVLSIEIRETSDYTVTISDGCTTPEIELTGRIAAAEVPGVDFSVDIAEQCPPATFVFKNETDPSLSDQLFWQFGNGPYYENESVIHMEEDRPGSYNVRLIVVSPEGCRDTLKKEKFFTVFEDPIAKFAWSPFNPKVTFPEAVFTNQSYLSNEYEWTFEEGEPAVSMEENPEVRFPEEKPGEYLVTLKITSEDGCTDSTANLIAIVPDILLYVPNTFTPDGDKFNEKWRIHIDGIDDQGFELVVFNRWGEIMWESHHPEAEWDGTYGGKPVPEGNYIWKIKAVDRTTDKKYEYSGHLNVLR